MKLYLLNYADDRFGHKGGRFLANQAKLNESARRQGIENIVSWTWPKLEDTSFYQENQDYLNKSRFDNGAVWKPFIVQQLLQEIQVGDIIFYYDCGAYTINRPVHILTDLCIRNGGTLFHEWGEKNAKYTKRDAFVYMNCDSPIYYNAPALQNTWFLLQKSVFAETFVNEWLRYNLDERIASYVKPNTCGLPDILGFVENRGDQSIFTNLAIKYGIRSFRGAGGIQNRQVDNFVDSLSRRSQTQRFIATAKSSTKDWLKTKAYQVGSTGKTLAFKVKDISFRLYPQGGAVRQFWMGDSSKERLLHSLLSLVDQNLTVIEVGANVGVTTVPLAKRLSQGRLLAIEADPDLCQHLKQNLELNSCLDRVTIVSMAISNYEGEGTLQVNAKWRDPYNTIGRPVDENCQIVKLSNVTVQPLTEVLGQTTKRDVFSQPDILIVDASGAELPILQGAATLLFSDVSPLVVYNCLHQACQGFGYQPHELQVFMRSKGYRLFKLDRDSQIVELSSDDNHQGFILCFKDHHFLMFGNIDFVFLSLQQAKS